MKYEWLDSFLLSLPGVEKDFKAEWGWFRYMIRGKLFAAVCSPKGMKDPAYNDHDLVNLKCDPRMTGSLRAEPGFYPAYHMNKESWITAALDGAVPAEKLKALIAQLEQSAAAMQ